MKAIKEIIRSKRGETLMESIISLLVLAVLIMAVTVTIQTALKITSISMQGAKEIQEKEINPAMLADYEDVEEDVQITFSFDIEGVNKTATHKVNFNKNGDITAFTPSEVEGP